MLIVAWFIACGMEYFLERCVGVELPLGRRDYVGFIRRFSAAAVCSPRLLGDSPLHWALLVGMWGPVPFAVANWLWLKRHKAYWSGVRAREKARRAEKRASKAAQTAAVKDQG